MLIALLLSPAAHARSEAPALFCGVYADSPLCAAGATSCVTCHETTGPPSLNPFGLDVQPGVAGQEFADALPAALAAIEGEDSDGDGADNLSEIDAGEWPGFGADIEPACTPQAASGNAHYAIGRYDAYLAWKRITLDFCGRSPRYEERLAFEAQMDALGWERGDGLSADPRENDEIRALLQGQLAACLASPYWDDVREEIGVGVVRPKGYNSDLSILGNYEWDLRLFRYATSGDRDAADLMQADYLVVEEPTGSGLLAAIDEPRNDTEGYAQPLAREHRYGLITTRFSLAMNVMFADVPRTLAAHWYRELLGLDLALSQGLYPVDETGAYDWPAPRDVDGKGVWQEDCAACHTTIDPLSYPWARYNGIDLVGNTTGIYLDDRAADILPDTAGSIFGLPVSGPEDWVAEAVASEHFSQHVVRLFWQYLFRRQPYSCEEAEFTALWQGFRAGSYERLGEAEPRVVQSMLAELILLDAYGTP